MAAGRFAPGHLGELTSIVSFELVDAVLSETRTVQRRLRDLPSRVGVYFLLAMCLFPEIGYRLVWDKLIAGLSGMPVVRPSVKALRDLRRRLGSPPVRALFEVLAGPLAQPTTPGLRFGPFRTVSFDGCSSIKVPDSERNRGWLGRCPHGGYPQVELMTLVETGTRAVIGAVFGPTREGETLYATRLLHHLGPEMLVLWDRGFDGNDFLAAVHATGARVLGRIRRRRRPPVLQPLADSSCLSVIGGVPVRIIEARVSVTCTDGSNFEGSYRLATTLLDAGRYPADHLVHLCHERWEHESALLRPAPYHPARTRPALARPGRRRAGDVVPAHPLPAPAPHHGRDGGVQAGHRPRPLRLHHRLASSMSSGFWHGSWGAVAERHGSVRLWESSSCEPAHSVQSSIQN
ncbi:transposase domain-containing protein [Streptomyces sp. TE33382]